MYKGIIFASFLLSFAVHADELVNFSAATKAISEGRRITFVVDFKQCSAQMPLPVAMASITPNAVLVVGGNRITASDRHFSLDDPSARGLPTFSYSKFNINSEGTASMNITVMSAVNYEQLNAYQINCNLGEGFKIFS